MSAQWTLRVNDMVDSIGDGIADTAIRPAMRGIFEIVSQIYQAVQTDLDIVMPGIVKQSKYQWVTFCVKDDNKTTEFR